MKVSYAVAISAMCGVVAGAIGVQGLHAQAKPKAYVITEIEVLDQAAFKEFLPKVAEATKAAGGSYLARGETISAIDGAAPKRVTIQVYDSYDQAKNSRNTPGWASIKELQKKATKTRSYAVEGL